MTIENKSKASAVLVQESSTPSVSRSGSKSTRHIIEEEKKLTPGPIKESQEVACLESDKGNDTISLWVSEDADGAIQCFKLRLDLYVVLAPFYPIDLNRVYNRLANLFLYLQFSDEPETNFFHFCQLDLDLIIVIHYS